MTQSKPSRFKRRVVGDIESPAESVRSFPDIVAKPKQPLPEPYITDEVTLPAERRRLGVIAIHVGDPIPDARLTPADRLALIRTPYDPTNTQEVSYRNRVKNRNTAITAMCITCVGTRKQVLECADCTCPLWAFRLGSSPFRGKV